MRVWERGRVEGETDTEWKKGEKEIKEEWDGERKEERKEIEEG